jgi:FtsZ-binding cell division protein ZapB
MFEQSSWYHLCTCLSWFQVLQRDKEALTQQLRALAPERFQRLLAENQNLRTASTELDILKEQVQHHKTAWQEVETKLTEMQVLIGVESGGVSCHAVNATLS